MSKACFSLRQLAAILTENNIPCEIIGDQVIVRRPNVDIYVEHGGLPDYIHLDNMVTVFFVMQLGRVNQYYSSLLKSVEYIQTIIESEEG